jgi:hypothetical protein
MLYLKSKPRGSGASAPALTPTKGLTMARANEEDATKLSCEDRLTLNVATALCILTSTMLLALALA